MAYALPIPTTRPALRVWPWVGAISSGFLLASSFLREATWPFAWALASAFLCLYVGTFGAGLSLLTKGTTEGWGLLAAPALWVALEVARSSGMLAFPWALLGASQIPNAPILQLASVAGPDGISLLLVLVNAALVAFAVAPRRAWPALLLTAAALAAAPVFGRMALWPTPAGTLLVASVQPNVPLEQKLNPQAANVILGRFESLIAAAAKTRPDVLVLPETVVPGDIFADPRGRARRC